MRPFLIFATLACLLTLGFLAADLVGQQPERKTPAAAKKMPVGVTPEREAAVKTFVERNHSELVELLELLKTNQPQEYERAIRELHRVTERLALIQERDSKLYDLELRAWQVHSRIQLLTAKVKMAGSDADVVRQELKDSIGEHVDARAALLSHERQRVEDRLSRISKDLARLQNERQQVVEKQFEVLTKAPVGAKNKKAAPGKKLSKAARGQKEKRGQSGTPATKTETNFKFKP